MKITKAHGNGGRQTQELINNVFKKTFVSKILATGGDAAALFMPGGPTGFTTDGFVVKPFLFEGGDIGKLAVCGTVNDLAVSGYRPLYMTAAFMIEEGFEIDDLLAIAVTMQQTAEKCGVEIVAGDTKVIERGGLDGIFIASSGIGTPWTDYLPSFQAVSPGQVILVSGDIGRHGACIYSHQPELGFEKPILSDCEPVTLAAEALFQTVKVSYMRDMTRGGMATALNEIASGSGCSLTLFETSIPIAPEVRGVADILGLDASYLACEGRFAVIVPEKEQTVALEILRRHHPEAAIIGCVSNDRDGRVGLQTEWGGTRILDVLHFEMLPRIC